VYVVYVVCFMCSDFRMTNFGEALKLLNQGRELAMMGQYDKSLVHFQDFLSQLSESIKGSNRKLEYKQVVL